MNNYTKKRNEIYVKNVIENLKKRYFEAYYVQTKEEALKKAIELIPKTDTISWGGSVTIEETGIIGYLKSNDYKIIDRDSAKSAEERTLLLKKALLADTYLMGTNAITKKGELVNIDAIGNRISALIFGPKNVIIVAGINKITENEEDAIKRVRNYCAPVNIQRIAEKREVQTPCLITGECADCKSPDSICSHILITRLCNPKNRIKIILTAETLGF